VVDKVTMAVQVNGKMRGTVEISPDAGENEVRDEALKLDRVIAAIEAQQIRKIIYVKGKIFNMVVS